MNDFYTKAIRYLSYHHNVTIENEVFKYHALQFVSEESDRCSVTVGSTNDQTVIITIIMLMLALNIDKPLYVHTTCDGETLIADMFHEHDDIPVNYKFPLPYKLDELKLSDRVFNCPKCKHIIDRDFNAAINIRDEGFRVIKKEMHGFYER